MRRVLFFVAFVAACKRDAPSPGAATDAAIAVDPSAKSVSAAAPSSTTAPSSSVAAIEPASPRTDTTPIEDLTPPESADFETPLVKIGKMTIWGVEDGDATRIVAKAGSTGKTKLLRRTSGKVKAFDAIAVSGDVVVAWASELAQGGTQVIAVLTASADLSKVTPPTTVAMVAAPIQLEGHVAIAKNPKGGVIVIHQGPKASCKLLEHPTECLTFEVKAISPGGVVTKLASEKLHGGPSPEYKLLDVDGRALAVLASSMRGGRSLAGVVVPYDANDPKPAFTVPICGGSAAHFPELVRGSAGEIVSVCLDSRFDHPKCVTPLRGDADRCPRIAAVALDGKDLAPAVKGRTAAVQKVECGDAGNPRLVLEGGASIELAAPLDAVGDFVPKCGK
jgi:hypothetical protein